MGRWTQFTEDSSRLPEGMVRISYDADTARYTFRDQDGNLYLGPPHEDYGTLTPMPPSSPTSAISERPEAFASGKTLKADLFIEVLPGRTAESSFHDFVPSHLITSPSSAESKLSPSPETSPSSRFRNAVRKTTLPSMQNVVNNLKRSATSARAGKKARDSEQDGLLRANSQASSKMDLTRSKASSIVSFESVDEQ